MSENKSASRLSFEWEFSKLFSYEDAGDDVKPLIRDVIISVIQDTLAPLSVISTLNQKVDDEYNAELVQYKTVDERYDTGDIVKIGKSSKKSSISLASVINTFSNILKATSAQIEHKGTFETLQYAVVSLNNMKEDDAQLIEETQMNENLLHSLKLKIANERLKLLKDIKRISGDIEVQKVVFDDYIFYNSRENKYFQQWEASRKEQNLLVCTNKEKSFLDIIDGMQKSINSEKKCHTQIMEYMEESKNDYMDDIQKWMKKYDDDIEIKDNEIIVLRDKLEKITEEHGALKDLFEDHRVFIENWSEHRRILKEQYEREQLEIWAATKIQAWWRGTMYRKKLGPYRKKRKGKKGKGKDKKRKK